MTKFILIDPENKNIRLAEAPTWRDAALTIDLPPDQCDHGVLGNRYGIFVYEWGLMRPRKHNQYWRLDNQLFNGPGVIYQEVDGESVDCSEHFINQLASKHIEFIGPTHDVEAAITDGRIIRPQITINGEIVWSWNKSDDTTDRRI